MIDLSTFRIFASELERVHLGSVTVGQDSDSTQVIGLTEYWHPTGTAPIEASSGDQRRHRLSRAGNRRINRILHIMAIVQLRHDTLGRAYYRRRLSEGKTTMEALRALKRHLSDVVYKRMVRDAKQLRAGAAGPAGQPGATLQSSAASPIPTADTSDKSQPGPASNKPRTFLAPTP
jgi:transposase